MSYTSKLLSVFIGFYQVGSDVQFEADSVLSEDRQMSYFSVLGCCGMSV